MRILIVGNGPAAVSAIEAIRESDQASEITVVTPEGPRAYTRCFLGKYLAGRIGIEELVFRPADFCDRHHVTELTGNAVTSVSPDEHEVVLANGERLAYDRLLLACGADSIVPDIPGIAGPGVVGFRNIADCIEIQARAEGTRHAIVLGSGFVALEAAEALVDAGVPVSLVARADNILRPPFDAQVAEIVEEHVARHGIRLIKERDATEVERDKDGRITGIVLSKGERVPCNLIVLAIGMRPNTRPIVGTAIAVNEGVLTDASMRTNIPDIWAAGDVAEATIGGVCKTNLIHPNAVVTGRVAGRAIAGAERPMPVHLNDLNVLTLFGRRFLSAGSLSGEETLTRATPSGDLLKIRFGRDGTIAGVQMVGNIARAGLYTSLIGRPLPEGAAERLLSPEFNFGEIERWPTEP